MTCERKWGDALVLWIARGFDVGRAPVAPGTFGSVVGLAWTLVLVATRSVWWYGLGVAAGLTLSVVVCGLAERILRERDPGSVVLDEITALPLCFAGWIGHHLWVTGAMPAPEAFVTGRGWLVLAAGFVAFRLLDVLKPWPIRQSQALPGGWGVTIDDVLAGLASNIVWIPCAWL